MLNGVACGVGWPPFSWNVSRVARWGSFSHAHAGTGKTTFIRLLAGLLQSDEQAAALEAEDSVQYRSRILRSAF